MKDSKLHREGLTRFAPYSLLQLAKVEHAEYRQVQSFLQKFLCKIRSLCGKCKDNVQKSSFCALGLV
jgi:hypothetical protein